MTTTRLFTALAFGCALGIAGSAQAADIFTPSLRQNHGNGETQLMSCEVLNTGGRTVAGVTIAIFNFVGELQRSKTVDLPPGQSDVVAVDTLVLGSSVYCRVSGIAKSSARVTLCREDGIGNCLMGVTAP
jgi:hypothetical protein